MTIELQTMLSAEHISELARDVERGSLRSIAGDFYEWIREGRSTSSRFDRFGIGDDEDQRLASCTVASMDG